MNYKKYPLRKRQASTKLDKKKKCKMCHKKIKEGEMYYDGNSLFAHQKCIDLIH